MVASNGFPRRGAEDRDRSRHQNQRSQMTPFYACHTVQILH